MSYTDRYRKDKGNLPLTHTQLSLATSKGGIVAMQRRRMDEEWTKNGRRMDEEWTKNGRRMDEEKVKLS
ncbi:hypothetical protein VJJ50_07630 [Capnocytophaga ochracea]|uniref:hypothetical protein n=1 Tax=Capnocytophaga ochracea TaxID=1018 RepID=UPI002B464311|nr:hypothetical protein [Capnocytophaga ochracea]MEB3016743.1 hypothetical protein [Capnocytophaga ochracea]